MFNVYVFQSVTNYVQEIIEHDLQMVKISIPVKFFQIILIC